MKAIKVIGVLLLLAAIAGVVYYFQFSDAAKMKAMIPKIIAAQNANTLASEFTADQLAMMTYADLVKNFPTIK